VNRHLAIKISCFSVVKLRKSPAIARAPRLESEYFNHNLHDPDLIRASLDLSSQTTTYGELKKLYNIYCRFQVILLIRHLKSFAFVYTY